MRLILHHLVNSRSQRILWLLEELNASYDIRTYQRDSITNLAPPELAQVHPRGKSPLLEADGRLIGESGAIVEYLCEQCSGDWLIPDREDDHYIDYLEFLHFAEGSAITPILLNLYASRLADAAAPILPRIAEQLDAHFQYMDKALVATGHFAGADWTAADVMMSFPAEIAVMNGAENYPHLVQFVKQCHARPAWKRARQRGGPYFMFQ